MNISCSRKTSRSLRGALSLFIAFTFTVASLPAAASAANEEKVPITVNGDKVEYYPEKKMVSALENISIVYKDVTLTCDKITVYLDTQEAIAEGNVKIVQKDSTITGDAINYNFGTKSGKIIQGRVISAPFYGKADSVEKIGDTRVKLANGYVTTCDLEKPHYRIVARSLDIYMDDRVVARHVFFYVRDVPILYIPYYMQPLKDQTAHATILVGRDKEWGYYGLSSFRYYFSEIASGRILIDYRTKKGIAAGIDNFYRTDSLGDGMVKFYFINENDSTTADRVTEDSRIRYLGQVRHRWDLCEDTVAIGELNYFSDRDFVKDYFYREYEELGNSPDNYISIVTSKEYFTSHFLLRKRMNNFYDVVERLPEYGIDVKNYRIGNTPFYHKASAAAVYLQHQVLKEVPNQKIVNVTRVDTYNQISLPQRVAGFWSVMPYAGTRQTYYSRNRWGETNLVRGIFQAGVDNSTKFYRIYDTKTKFAGIDINKLRHIITPSANYYYMHNPTIDPSNLQQFDEVDALTRQNGVRLSLENKLQTKRPSGKEMESIDLATFIVGTDYMYQLDRNWDRIKVQKFRSVDFLLEMNPYPWLFFSARSSVNTKRRIVETYGGDITASGGDSWSLGLGQRYEKTDTNQSNLFTVDARYKINEKWRIRVYERIEANGFDLEAQEYTISRDLHCWIAEFTYSIRESNNHSFWFVMRLKAFPEVPLGLSQSYSRPTAGWASS